MNEYDDVVYTENEQDQEDDNDPIVLDPESWHDWNSEHLLNMYMSLVEYCETQGLTFMKNVPFNDFCHFIFNRAV